METNKNTKTKLDYSDINIIKINSPAKEWNESYLIGNGRVGGAVYGGVNQERIDLSEITFFSGNASIYNNQKGAPKAFYEMRRLVSGGDYKKAKEIAEGFTGNRLNYGTNLPVGHILIDFSYEDNDSIIDYDRTINFMQGMVCVQYDIGGTHITREAFISQKRK